MRTNVQILKDLFEQPGFVYMQEQRFSNQQIVNHQIQGGLAWTVAKPRRVKPDFPGAQAGCSCQMLMMRLRIKMMVIVMMMRVVVMMMIVVTIERYGNWNRQFMSNFDITIFSLEWIRM